MQTTQNAPTTTPMWRGATKQTQEAGKSLACEVQKKPSNIILVTPQLATLWLSQNTKRNRPRSKSSVEKYVRIMKRGEWRPNPSQPISFTKEGILVNGQHRLKAVVEANIPVYMAVVWDAEDADFDIIDTGKKRTLGDIFALDGIKNYNTVSSMVVRRVALGRGLTLHLDSDSGGALARTLDLAQDYLDEYGTTPELYQEVLNFVRDLYANGIKMLTTSDMGGIAMFLIKDKKHDKSKVLGFFDALYNGGSTYRYLQDLAVALNNDATADKKMRPSRKQSLIAKAWNMFLADSQAKHVRVHMGEVVDFN